MKLTRLGIGTYLGNLSETTSQNMQKTLHEAVTTHHLNVIDTAINYRCQLSERTIGKLISSLQQSRSTLYISTKGGFIPFDQTVPKSVSEYVNQSFMKPLNLTTQDIHDHCHSIHPTYLKWSFEQSLRNLNTPYVDCYFIHNPEFALTFMTRTEWEKRLLDCFAWLESEVTQGRCRMYGIATWQGLRVAPKNPQYIDLHTLWHKAQTLGYTNLRALQLPFNIHLNEFITLKNQRHLQSPRWWLTPNEWIREHDITTFTSAPFLEGQLITHFQDITEMAHTPDSLTPAQHLLDWVLANGNQTTTLVGTTSLNHLKEAVSRIPLKN